MRQIDCVSSSVINFSTVVFEWKSFSNFARMTPADADDSRWNISNQESHSLVSFFGSDDCAVDETVGIDSKSIVTNDFDQRYLY